MTALHHINTKMDWLTIWRITLEIVRIYIGIVTIIFSIVAVMFNSFA